MVSLNEPEKLSSRTKLLLACYLASGGVALVIIGWIAIVTLVYFIPVKGFAVPSSGLRIPMAAHCSSHPVYVQVGADLVQPKGPAKRQKVMSGFHPTDTRS